MNTVPGRKQRRLVMKFQGIHKMKANLSFEKRIEFMKNSINAGKEIWKTKNDEFDVEINKQLEIIEIRQIEYWKKIGYNDSQINTLREAWAELTVKDKENWHKIKKEARLKIRNVIQNTPI